MSNYGYFNSTEFTFKGISLEGKNYSITINDDTINNIHCIPLFTSSHNQNIICYNDK